MEDQLVDEELNYLAGNNAINRLAKKIQDDWSGQFVHFEKTELSMLGKLHMSIMSDHRTVVSREGVPYVLQYRRLEGRLQERIDDLMDRMTQFPLRETQMRYLMNLGVNKLARMLEADRQYQQVVDDHELRRIFSLIGIKLNSEQFMVKTISREMVTYTVPNNPGEDEKRFYTRFIKNSRACDTAELERLRDFGLLPLAHHPRNHLPHVGLGLVEVATIPLNPDLADDAPAAQFVERHRNRAA